MAIKLVFYSDDIFSQHFGGILEKSLSTK